MYYVKYLSNGPQQTPVRGWSFTPDWHRNMMTVDIYDSTVLPNNADFYTSSHEVNHVFTQSGDHPKVYNQSTNLATFGTTSVVKPADTSHTNTKRLDEGQQKKIWASEYAK